jgi:hypothetical protein
LVTVVQRGTCSSWTPTRVARVRVKREVDLIDVGRLVVKEGWHTRHAIYPAGNFSFSELGEVLLQTLLVISFWVH